MHESISDNDLESSEDILHDSLAFLGGKPVVDDELIRYGPLRLTVAPKEGKANTLLADHLFSPALFLAERIERGLIPAHNAKMIELGSGCALPSLLASTLPSSERPSLVVVTDYPDDVILNNLKKNVERNLDLVASGCIVQCLGYEWGADVRPLMKPLSTFDGTETPQNGYDIVILSDLLHFHTSHDVLISSVTLLLSRTPTSRVHVAAGTYTRPHVCADFIRKAEIAGLIFVEETSGDATATGSSAWLGRLEVSGLDREQLAVRKAMCRYWVGRWADASLV